MWICGMGVFFSAWIGRLGRISLFDSTGQSIGGAEGGWIVESINLVIIIVTIHINIAFLMVRKLLTGMVQKCAGKIKYCMTARFWVAIRKILHTQELYSS